jgi:hypothetical protein
MRMILSLLTTAALLAATSAATSRADERPLPVFVLAGTSNMLGSSAKLENLPKELQEPTKDVLSWRQGEWLPLEPGKNLVGNEATFGQALAKHFGRPVGIHWISVRYVASPSPGPSLSNLVKQSRERGRPIEIVGMLLDVSYGDGLKEETAKAYGEGLVRWVEALRRDLDDADLPIVLMRAIPPQSAKSHLETVRQAQDALTQDALKLPNFRVVKSDDIERGGDRVHFTTAGRLMLGRRYAEAMIELLPSK